MSIHARNVDVARHTASGVELLSDAVAVEEPLEIRVEGPDGVPVRVAVTMRTPGHDDELAAGFLRSEGLLDGLDDLVVGTGRFRLAVADAGQVVTIRVARDFDASRLARNFFATSSCGVCGKAALEHIETHAGRVATGQTIRASVIGALPQTLREAQSTFDVTGGLHATGLFSLSGELLHAREDVGRHNAMDKVLGRALLDGRLPLSEHVLCVSGRTSFELVQKAAMAGVPIVCAVSAPSSLAVALAERVGITLVGFARGERFNVYAHRARVRG